MGIYPDGKAFMGDVDYSNTASAVTLQHEDLITTRFYFEKVSSKEEKNSRLAVLLGSRVQGKR